MVRMLLLPCYLVSRIGAYDLWGCIFIYCLNKKPELWVFVYVCDHNECYRQSQSFGIRFTWATKMKVKTNQLVHIWIACIPQVRLRCGFKNQTPRWNVGENEMWWLAIKPFHVISIFFLFISDEKFIAFTVRLYFNFIFDPIPFLIRQSLWPMLMFVCVDFVPVCFELDFLSN